MAQPASHSAPDHLHMGHALIAMGALLMFAASFGPLCGMSTMMGTCFAVAGAAGERRPLLSTAADIIGHLHAVAIIGAVQ